MRILRIRPGFQADHSSSSYLFYAVEGEVSPAGQRVAHRFSSGADVDEEFARYQKWGESSLAEGAFRALLGEHYDVMASESYDSWTLMIAVPKTAALEKLLLPFRQLDDGEFVRLSVHNYGKRLAVEIFCELDYDGPLWSSQGDSFERLVKLLAKIRGEILTGDVSFLQAVAEFYGAGEEEEPDEEVAAQPMARDQPITVAPPKAWTKAQLQEECGRLGIPFQKSWTKEVLRQALTSVSGSTAVFPTAEPSEGNKARKLSRAASLIVNSLDHR